MNEDLFCVVNVFFFYMIVILVFFGGLFFLLSFLDFIKEKKMCVFVCVCVYMYEFVMAYVFLNYLFCFKNSLR